MGPEPAAYLRAALEAAGLQVHRLIVEEYAPETFGNLVVVAETSAGELRIIYDRGFYVEAREPARFTHLRGKVIDAVETARRSQGPHPSRSSVEQPWAALGLLRTVSRSRR